jgi:hypothetical protein
MPKYQVTTVVEYIYEVEADNQDDAEKQGWGYEDYPYAATVQTIEVEEVEEYEDEDGDDDGPTQTREE